MNTFFSDPDGQTFLKRVVTVCESDSKIIPAELKALHQQAQARLLELTLPTPQDEEWKYLDLSPLLTYGFQPFLGSESLRHSLTKEQVDPFIWPESQESCLVFVNGIYAPELSRLSQLPPGVKAGSLLDQITQDPQRLEAYLQTMAGDDVFTTLNAACFRDGALVSIPKALDLPLIQLLFLSVPHSSRYLDQPRCLVIAHPGSSGILIEDYVSLGNGIHFSNAVTEVWVGSEARIHHIQLQRQSCSSFNILKTAIRQERNSQYTLETVAWGSELARHTLELFQVGEQAETMIHGLTLLQGGQEGDTHTTIEHRCPYGKSQQIHKCIVDNRAHAVFNGKLIVQKAAQLTDARQSSRNLLLSQRARVDTQPQLEILADNVKCAHGATVSQLEGEELFYLQSRGINAETARYLLKVAFAADISDRIPLGSIRSYLRQQVLRDT
jgi:Fe-S cluster assembly protein SufD